MFSLTEIEGRFIYFFLLSVGFSRLSCLTVLYSHTKLLLEFDRLFL